MKTLIYTILLNLLVLFASSCNSNSILTKNKVTTCYTNNTGDVAWTKKKIPLKSLRILIANGIETPNTLPYKSPTDFYALHFKVHGDTIISTDTTFESGFYNRIALSAISEKALNKANLTIMTDYVSEENLKKIKQTGKYDVVLVARKLIFDYHVDYGRHFVKQKHEPIVQNSYSPHFGSTDWDPLTSHNPYQVIEVKCGVIDPFMFNKVVYHTCWELQWLKPTTSENTVARLEQKGIVQRHTFNIDAFLTFVAQEAGLSLASVLAR